MWEKAGWMFMDNRGERGTIELQRRIVKARRGSGRES